ncbi:MAG: MG2 domain-containing protein, partial [Candidatus Competibacterales bacterium]|nr:MG2 domain-containing protein [Candidatus Competibacterales bacterium]
MNRPARLLFPLLLLLLPIMQGVAFEDPTLSLEAGRYHDRMRQARGSEQPEQSLQRARRYASQSLWRDAIDEYEAVIAADAATPTVWYRLAQAWNRYDSGWRGQRRARAAAYTSYRTADAPDLRARALFQLGELLLENEPRLAREAWREGLGLVENERIAERYRKLDEQLAFQVKELDVESDSARPRICLRYSETLAQGRDLHHADYLQLDPAIDPVVSIHDDRLCIEGVSHGTTYTVTVRPGLPAASGERTRDSQRFVAEVENRSPSVGFRGRTYILPRTGDQNLPLTTVNVDRVRIEVLRINDRNLTQQINADNLLRLLDGYDSRRIAEQSGESVWSGALDIRRELNQEVSSALPMREVLPHTEPGIYVVTAHDAADDPSHWQDLATQWLVISDLGLTTLQGEDGLHAFVRSLASAGPLADVELRLYARNNSELGRVVTDERGYGQFPAGLLGGRGGRTPAALMAYGTDGDFNFLDLTTAAFDLGDRGVSGRPAPDPYDAFLYSDRGVYRPGETVQLVALLRDARGRVPAQIPPLTLSLIRPDQAEAERRVLDQHLLGGFHTALNLPGNARTGRWLARLHLDPEADPVGELRFLVEDFVPQRLDLSLATEAERLAPGSPVQVEVSGRFLYGAPAAELATEAELVLREAATPFPDHADFHFGPVDAEFSPQRETLDIPPTDARGRSAVTVALAEPPQTQRPLEAVLRVALFEPGGRPVNRRLVLPYRNQPLALGIRPDFADPVSRQQPLAFDLVALDPAGEPQALADLRYTLYRENHDYYWYYRNNRWNYRLVVSDSAPLVSRSIGLDAAPTRLELAGLDSGRYRLEVSDPASGALGSLKFRVGWFVEPGGEARPDELQITLDRSSYGAGDIARVHVRAPFAGEVLLTVADHRLWLARSFTLEEGGTTFELPVDPAWSPGVYL